MRVTDLMGVLILFFGSAAMAGQPAGPAAPPAPPLRGAIVTATGSKALQSLADLVTATVPPSAGLQLLERDEIQPVLEEHETAAEGLTDPARAVAAGRLLSVDLFAVLANDPAGVGLVAYDGRSGVRLVDQMLPGKTAAEQATAAVATLELGLAKQSAQTHPVCLLTVRNADLGSSMDCFCDGIGQILLRRLLTSTQITILERQYLDQLNKERLLPTSRPATPLMPSLQFMELEIDRGKHRGSYAATVFLSDSNGNKLGSVGTDADDSSLLVEQLVAKLVEKLGVTSPQRPDSVRESMRFGAESDFFRSHGQCASALAASEAAYALNPSDTENQKRLAKDLTNAATGSCPLDVALPQLDRALNLCRGYERTARNQAGLLDGSYFDVENGIGNFIAAHCASANDSHPSAALESLRTGFRDYQIEKVQRWAASSGAAHHDSKWADSAESSANALWGRVIPDLSRCSLTRTELAGDLDEVVGRQWLGAYRKRTSHVWWDQSFSSFIACIYRGYEVWHPYQGAFPLSEPDLREYARAIPALYQKFAVSDDPAFQLCGTAGQAWCEAVGGGRSLNDLQEPFQPVVAFAKQSIASSSDSDARDRMYMVWEKAIDLFFRPNSVVIDDNSIPSKQRLQELYVMWDFRKTRHEFPAVVQNTKPISAPWVRVDRICEVHKTAGLENIDAIIHPLIREGSVWMIGLGQAEGHKFMQLLRIPLDGGPAQGFSRLPMSWDNNLSPPNCSSLSGGALAEDCYYLSTRSSGILAFPHDGRAAFSITDKDGLPTNHVDSIAYLDDHLYAGLGDGGYIIRFDPTNKECDVLASSRRKEKRSPLDDDLSWKAPCMCADAPRHRVVFLAGRGFGDHTGIWQIDAAGALTQLYKTSQIAFGDWCSDVDGDHLIMSTNQWILDLDLTNDHPQVLHKNPYGSIGPKIVPASASITPNVNLFPPYLARDGWLWAGHDFTRTNISTGQTQDLPELSSSVGHERIVPADVLQMFDHGHHALIGDQTKLWMLTFNTDDPATKP